MDTKIGYIINESGCEVDNFQVLEESEITASLSNSLDFPHPAKDKVIGIGVLQTGDRKNRNGRIYKTEDLIREIHANRQRELLTTGNFMSEVGHPIGQDASSLVRQQTIDPKNTCCRFLKLWNEGSTIMGYFQGTNNDNGTTFDKDLRQMVKPAFSLRALGTVKATPQGALVENLKMITYDYVIYPSHPEAYTQGVVTESAGIALPSSAFKINDANNAERSYMHEFTRDDVIKSISSLNESAIDYIKDKSYNFHLLKECFEMTSFDTIDYDGNNKIILTEAGKQTIVMNVEDYIVKEIQNYR